MVFGKKITLSTKGFSDIKDITGEVKSIVSRSGIKNGIIIVFVIGFVTAAGVGALCIRYLIEHVKTKTFLPFALYRIALGVLLFVTLYYSSS